jgi:Putative beta barrel porin-7 (BBP7)
VVLAMRYRMVQLAAFVSGALLLSSLQVSGQTPPAPAPGDAPVFVIHSNLHNDDQIGEPDPVIHQELPATELTEQPTLELNRVWARADYWLAWIKGVTFPVLVTQGATTDTPPGALNQMGTEARFGGGEVVPQDRQGARFQFGGWLDCNECLGLEIGGMFLASRNVGIGLVSPGTPILARPFFNTSTQLQDSSIVAFPGVASGSVNVISGTSLYGVDSNVLVALNGSKDYPVRLLLGFRYLDLHDDLTITENVQVNASAPDYGGANIGVQDNFSCDNYFYGGNIGVSGSYCIRNLEIQATAQCAMGLCQENVSVGGLTSINGAGGLQTIPAGLLAVSSNSGTHIRNVFAVVPEADLDVRYEFTRHFIFSVGYSFLYWDQVARAGQQVDTNVNPDLVPTSKTYNPSAVPPALQQPQLSIHDTDFWAHGVHIGLEVRF